MECRDCGNSDIGEIGFSTIGSGIRFFFCRRCESRWWVSNAGELELRSVLEAARVSAKA